MELNRLELPHLVVGSVMEVHKHLGPGLLHSAYKECLAQEFRMREILFRKNSPVAVEYKGIEVPTAFTFDFVIEESIALHVYAVESLDRLHKETLRNHLQLSGLETGFMVNFNCVELRKGGLKRLIVSDHEPELPWQKVDDPDLDRLSEW